MGPWKACRCDCFESRVRPTRIGSKGGWFFLAKHAAGLGEEPFLHAPGTTLHGFSIRTLLRRAHTSPHFDTRQYATASPPCLVCLTTSKVTWPSLSRLPCSLKISHIAPWRGRHKASAREQGFGSWTSNPAKLRIYSVLSDGTKSVSCHAWLFLILFQSFVFPFASRACACFLR